MLVSVPKVIRGKQRHRMVQSSLKHLQARDAGGPSRQFLSEVWRQLDQVSVTSNEITLTLFGRQETSGYLMPRPDGYLDQKLKVSHDIEVKEVVVSKYRAVGRILLQALIQQHPIANHVLPEMYRNWLIRNVKPTSDAYEMADLVHHMFTMIHHTEKKDGQKTELDVIVEAMNALQFGDQDEIDNSVQSVRQFAQEQYIDGYKIALDAIKDGLTCNGKKHMFYLNNVANKKPNFCHLS